LLLFIELSFNYHMGNKPKEGNNNLFFTFK